MKPSGANIAGAQPTPSVCQVLAVAVAVRGDHSGKVSERAASSTVRQDWNRLSRPTGLSTQPDSKCKMISTFANTEASHNPITKS